MTVPPLRAHADDIPHLAQFFLDRLAAECRREWALTPEAVRLLRERPWPGNVRQLKGVLGHAAAIVSGETITAGPSAGPAGRLKVANSIGKVATGNLVVIASPFQLTTNSKVASKVAKTAGGRGDIVMPGGWLFPSIEWAVK